MTTTQTHDPKVTDDLTPLPISVLVIATWNLLEEASNLPQPRYLCVSGSQSIDLGFTGGKPGYRAITRWARRFGAELHTRPHTTSDGEQKTYALATFDYHGIAVEAFAFVTPDAATT